MATLVPKTSPLAHAATRPEGGDVLTGDGQYVFLNATAWAEFPSRNCPARRLSREEGILKGDRRVMRRPATVKGAT